MYHVPHAKTEPTQRLFHTLLTVKVLPAPGVQQEWACLNGSDKETFIAGFLFNGVVTPVIIRIAS